MTRLALNGARPPAARSPHPRRRPAWRSVAVPTEHGGWGLTLEPVVLGLLVAFSAAGLAIGAAAVVVFVARTPLKVVLVDRHRHRRLPRTKLAQRILAGEVLAILALLAVAAVLAAGPFWVPFLAAAPLVGVELGFDVRSRSRRLVPELAGAIAIGSVAAAIVVAASDAASVATAAWLVIAARSVASIPFVRLQLGRAKRRGPATWPSDLAQAAAIAVVVIPYVLGWLPAAGVAAIAALAVAQLVLARVRPPKATVVGAQQVVLGLAVVVTAGVAL